LGRTLDVNAETDRGLAGIRVRIYDNEAELAPVRSLTHALLEQTATVLALFTKVSQLVEGLPDLPRKTREGLAILAQAGQLLAALQKDVRFLTTSVETDWVIWFEPGQASQIKTLGATPLATGPLLRDFWLTSGLRPIMTSATLAVGEDFGPTLHELGLHRLQPPVSTSLETSPFDFTSQALFLAPSDFPAPDSSAYPGAVAEVLTSLRQHFRRKTMVLFTSYRMLQDVAARLTEPSQMAPGLWDPLKTRVEILPQTTAEAAPDLMARFRGAPEALLLGTTTFWEGVDLPGSDLEILVVAKLPFLVPTDPWVEARCGQLQASGEDPFHSFMVRDAVHRLRQGVGRLIRSDRDTGVLVLLDSRLQNKPYGVTFLSALPSGVRWFASAGHLVEQIGAFFEGPEN
jgi:Rad3-related DNA helicase